jgi:putative phosphoribosyl transferase
MVLSKGVANAQALLLCPGPLSGAFASGAVFGVSFRWVMEEGNFLARAKFAAVTIPFHTKNVNIELPYRDRRQAGRILAAHLRQYAGRQGVIVLGLPRGGVPVAYEIAAGLDAPLDIFVVRKLGVPGREELAMGAIASGGVRVLNSEVLAALKIQKATLQKVIEQEEAELRRRETQLRGAHSIQQLEGKTIILVDDGLATGASMRAAVRALKIRNVRRRVVAVPVAAPRTCVQLQAEVDEVVCPATPESFRGVGQFYRDFTQTTDDEVRDLLARAAEFGTASRLS